MLESPWRKGNSCALLVGMKTDQFPISGKQYKDILKNKSRTIVCVCVCVCVFVLVTQSCLTLCDPMDFIPKGSSVHGILQQEYQSG